MEVPSRLSNEIRQYCKDNGIKDFRAFEIRCLEQGFSIIKYGTSPMDNIRREELGIKDTKVTEHPKEIAPVKEPEKVPEEKPVVSPERPRKTKSGIKIIKKS